MHSRVVAFWAQFSQIDYFENVYRIYITATATARYITAVAYNNFINSEISRDYLSKY